MTTSQQSEDRKHQHTLPRPLASALGRVRSRHTLVRTTEVLAVLLSLILCLVTTQLLLDYFLDLSRTVRAILSGITAIIFILFAFPRLNYLIRKRWTDESAALAIQRQWPALGSSVISTLQFSRAKGTSVSPSLFEQLGEDTANRLKPLPLGEITPLKALAKRLALLLIIVGSLSYTAYRYEDATRILIARLALQEIPLPTDTRVFPVTEDLLISAGSRVELTARIEGITPNQGQVEVQPERGERRQVNVPLERGVEEPRYTFAMDNVQQSFRYRFRIGDGAGLQYQVTVVPAPVLQSAQLTFNYPDYTGNEPRSFAIGPMTLFERGSVQLEGTASQSLQSATAILHFADNTTEEVQLDISRGSNFNGSFEMPDIPLAGLSINLRNTDGIDAIEPTVYPVTVEPDQPPVVTMNRPEAMSDSLVSGVALPVNATIRDDFGISKVELVYELTTSGNDEVRTFRRAIPFSGDTLSLNLASAQGEPAWREGTTITWWIEAYDNRQPKPAGRGVSEQRQLSYVSLAQKQAELLERLDEASRLIEQIAERQNQQRDQLGSALRSGDDDDNTNRPQP